MIKVGDRVYCAPEWDEDTLIGEGVVISVTDGEAEVRLDCGLRVCPHPRYVTHLADNNQVEAEAAKKHSKPMARLIPGKALLAVAEVLTHGAKKYAPESWKSEPFSKKDYQDAMLRHWFLLQEGERRDRDSGLLHAAHIACNALMALWYELGEGE